MAKWWGPYLFYVDGSPFDLQTQPSYIVLHVVLKFPSELLDWYGSRCDVSDHSYRLILLLPAKLQFVVDVSGTLYDDPRVILYWAVKLQWWLKPKRLALSKKHRPLIAKTWRR